MGRGKDKMIEDEGLNQEALRILEAVGAIENCEYHDGTYIDASGDLIAAYKLANSEISSGKLSLPGEMSRTDFTDLIKQVYGENSAIKCPACQKYKDS